jgi:tRNA pseudouridine13 synthase
MGEVERRIVSNAKVEAEDFMVTGLPHCCAKGDWREILCKVSDLRTEMSDGGYSLSFYLTKGNYATCLMREYLKAEMNRY